MDGIADDVAVISRCSAAEAKPGDVDGSIYDQIVANVQGDNAASLAVPGRCGYGGPILNGEVVVLRDSDDLDVAIDCVVNTADAAAGVGCGGCR